MDIGALRALVLDMNFEAHGVPIVVRAPDAERAVETRGIWSAPIGEDSPGFARSEPSLTRSSRIRVMSIRRSELESVPIGSEIDATEIGDTEERTWTVSSVERVEADRAYLILEPPEDCRGE